MRRPPARAPWLSAAAMAGTYIVLAGSYILLSSGYAGDRAASVAELRQVEILKGLAFVGVTAIAMFLFNGHQLRQLREHQDRRLRIDRAIHNAERAMLAGTFASSVAHDINNGLSAAMLSLEELQLHVSGDPVADPLAAEAAAALQRIREWNRRFFELGGARMFGEPHDFDIAETMRTCASIARRHQAIRETKVTPVIPGAVPFLGREELVQRALLNLLLNAAEAAGPGGEVRFALEGSAAEWRIIVDDSGPGVPEEMRARILEPFYTSKETGSGLGLASVVACCALHQGSVQISDSPLGGARFTMYLHAGAAA